MDRRAEVMWRLEEARRQKTMVDPDLREGYFFASPHRDRRVSSHQSASHWRPRDAAELNTAFAMECAGDFPTVILNTFMPMAEPWVALRAPQGTKLEGDAQKQLEAQAKQHIELTLDAIRSSNFYAEFGKTANPDLSLGVIGMWIEDPGHGRSIECTGIPIRELEFNIGPKGTLDERFIVRHTKYGRLQAVLPDLFKKFSPKLRDKIARNPKKECTVTWAFWREYDEISQDEVWCHTVLVDKEIVKDEGRVRGVGSCHLIIGRFNACPEYAWPAGPLIQALPDLRVLDELTLKKVKNLDNVLDPAITWPDDSFVNVENGIENGMAYQVRPGTEGAIKNIYTPNSPDVAIYEKQDLETRIKRLLFLDFPEQTGKTPPTLGQWLDEMTRAQQRIGTPGLAFWNEFPAAVFQRFRYLLIKRGDLQPIKVDGKPVALQPYNPAVRASEQQEVASFAKGAQIAAGLFPEEWKMLSDGKDTIENIMKKTGGDAIWKMRKPADVQNAIDGMKQLMGGTAPNAPPVPSGQPMPTDLAGPQGNMPEFQVRGHGL